MRSLPASTAFAPDRTLSSDVRSSSTTSNVAPGTASLSPAAASAPFPPASRTAMTMRAPFDASARAVSRPSPDDAPVTTAVRPERSTPSTTSSVVVSNPKAIAGPRGSVDQDVRARETLRLAQRVIRGERAGAVGHGLDVAVGVEVEVRAVHVEPDLCVVLDALQPVHRPRGLVEERAGPVDVLVLLVLPAARRRVTPHRTGVAVRLDLEAGLEDVLDDPEALALLHLDHLQLVAVADVDERQLSGADMDGRGCALEGHGHGEVSRLSLGVRPPRGRIGAFGFGSVVDVEHPPG